MRRQPLERLAVPVPVRVRRQQLKTQYGVAGTLRGSHMANRVSLVCLAFVSGRVWVQVFGTGSGSGSGSDSGCSVRGVPKIGIRSGYGSTFDSSYGYFMFRYHRDGLACLGFLGSRGPHILMLSLSISDINTLVMV